MQQVEGRQRFWWRALDAQTSSQRPASVELRPAALSASTLYIPSRSRPSPRQKSYKLQIPRGERRLRLKRRRSGTWLRFIAGCTVACGALAAGAAVLPVDRIRSMEFASQVQDQAIALMIATGFGIDQVSITGQRHASDRDVYDALDLPNVRTFAEFDSAAALKRIERIPWIETAQITRSYPSGLDIVVEERTPAVIWARGGIEYLIDATGRLLGPNPQPNEWSLPRVVGEGAGTEAANLLTAMQPYPSIARAFAYAERVSERRWRIVLQNGSKIELGPDRESEGFAEIAERRELLAALRGPAMNVDLRTVGRVVTRPLDIKNQKTAALDMRDAGNRP